MRTENGTMIYALDDEFPELAFHPDASQMPPMDNIEGLADSIKALGLKNSIVLWDGKIWAGRNRYRACRLLHERGDGNHIRTREWSGDESCAEAEALIEDVMRRHLTESQRAWIGVNTPKRILAQICAKNNNGNGDGRHRELVSRVFGVSTGLVDAASKVRKGPKSLGAAVLDKRVKVSFAAKALSAYRYDEIQSAIMDAEAAAGSSSSNERVGAEEARKEFMIAFRSALAAVDQARREEAEAEDQVAISDPAVFDESDSIDGQHGRDSESRQVGGAQFDQSDPRGNESHDKPSAEVTAASEADENDVELQADGPRDDGSTVADVDFESVLSCFNTEIRDVVKQWPKHARTMQTFHDWYERITQTPAGQLLKEDLAGIDIEFVCHSVREDGPEEKCRWCHIDAGDNPSHACKACGGRKWVTAKQYRDWNDRFSAKHMDSFPEKKKADSLEADGDSDGAGRRS